MPVPVAVAAQDAEVAFLENQVWPQAPLYDVVYFRVHRPVTTSFALPETLVGLPGSKVLFPKLKPLPGFLTNPSHTEVGRGSFAPEALGVSFRVVDLVAGLLPG